MSNRFSVVTSTTLKSCIFDENVISVLSNPISVRKLVYYTGLYFQNKLVVCALLIKL